MRRLPLRSPPRMRGKVPVCCPEHRKVRITPACAGKSAGRCIVLKEPYGSPPRMRGKETSGTRLLQRFRITPAYAGKRRCCAYWRQDVRDHPRVCGEKFSVFSRTEIAQGSPPRMRGKGTTKNGCSCPGGITPAYAGKRLGLCGLNLGREDHPRVCGEKSLETKT